MTAKDDRAIMLHSFDLVLDLCDALLNELPDSGEHMRSRELVRGLRQLVRWSRQRHGIKAP